MIPAVTSAALICEIAVRACVSIMLPPARSRRHARAGRVRQVQQQPAMGHPSKGDEHFLKHQMPASPRAVRGTAIRLHAMPRSDRPFRQMHPLRRPYQPALPGIGLGATVADTPSTAMCRRTSAANRASLPVISFRLCPARKAVQRSTQCFGLRCRLRQRLCAVRPHDPPL